MYIGIYRYGLTGPSKYRLRSCNISCIFRITTHRYRYLCFDSVLDVKRRNATSSRRVKFDRETCESLPGVRSEENARARMSVCMSARESTRALRLFHDSLIGDHGRHSD